MGASVETPAGKPRIFVSYARSDSSALADELVAGLEVAGFEPYLDRHDIAAAEDWEARLGALILSADTVVFILSPAAVRSDRCAWEVERARKLGKRVIPVEGKPTLEADVPERLRRLQYIIFREGQSFAKPLRELTNALRQDVEWIREHTRLGEAAARWRARTQVDGGAADDLLLRGGELTAAKAWVVRRKDETPDITPLLGAFLGASEEKAAALEDEKRRELAEREQLVAETEHAQTNIRRVQRRSFILLTGLLLVVLLGTGLGLWAVYAGWRELMVNRSQFLAGMTDQSAARGGYVDAMLIGLEALPDETGVSFRQRALPLEASAQNALKGAWQKWSSEWAERKLLAGHTSAVSAVAFSSDGLAVTGSSDDTARVWDAAGRPIVTLEGHKGPVLSVAFEPVGSGVLTGSGDNTARLWEATTGKPVGILEGHTGPVLSVAYSLDGSRVATGSLDKTARVWDAATGRPIATLIGHAGGVRTVTFLPPDSARVLTGSDDGTARLWSAETGKTTATFKGHTAGITATSFSLYGERILTGSADGTARLWEAGTGKLLATLKGHTGAVTAVAFSPDGARVLTGSSDSTARLWDAFTGKALATLEGHASDITSVEFSPGGGLVLTGSDDRTARVWDGATGALVAMLDGHTSGVLAIAFSRDGEQILTGSRDGTARLWDATNGHPLHTSSGEEMDRLLASFSSAQAVVENTKDTVPRCLTSVQRETFHLGSSPPRWCYERHLWPFAEDVPPPVTWDERLVAAWDRAAVWFGETRPAK
jgi:WD40 repeat protein